MMWQTRSTGSADTEHLGELLSKFLHGSEVIELRADLGGGKTTFVRGLARGLGSGKPVTSPTFIVSRVYHGKNNIELVHFDLYRLSEPGLVGDQLAEALKDPKTVTVVEWGEKVSDILPEGRLTVELKPVADEADVREISIAYNDDWADIIRQLEAMWERSRP